MKLKNQNQSTIGAWEEINHKKHDLELNYSELKFKTNLHWNHERVKAIT